MPEKRVDNRSRSGDTHLISSWRCKQQLYMYILSLLHSTSGSCHSNYLLALPTKIKFMSCYFFISNAHIVSSIQTTTGPKVHEHGPFPRPARVCWSFPPWLIIAKSLPHPHFKILWQTFFVQLKNNTLIHHRLTGPKSPLWRPYSIPLSIQLSALTFFLVWFSTILS